MPRTKNKRIYLTLERDGGKLVLYLKIPKVMEDFFKELSQGKTKTSALWQKNEARNQGAEFYTLTDGYIELEKRLSDYTYNDYGDGLMRNSRINLAPLRTIGASQGVRLYADNFNETSGLDLEYYVRTLGQQAKTLWERVIMKRKIKAVITFEI